MLCSILQNRSVGVPARSYIYVAIQPLNANYTVTPQIQPWDPVTGLSLHFMYSANANMNFRSSSNPAAIDYVPQSIDAEFEGPSVFTVPFDGTLTYIGGNIDPADALNFKTWIYYDDRPCSGRPRDPIDTSNYAPMFHWLKHYPNPDTNLTSFTVPDNHTYLLTQNSANTVLVNGVLAQPGTNSPGMLVTPGDTVMAVAPTSQVLITGWLG
jgi:hypothetical protein